jgi:hypothetical protein
VLAGAGGVARAAIRPDNGGGPLVDAVPELGPGSITCAAALLTFGTLVVTSWRRRG